MRLNIKIILSVVFVALFIGSISVTLVNHLMRSALEDEMKKRCIDITQAISEIITENVINNEVLPTREILRKIVQRSKDIEFAYVVGFDGNIFAHSFEKGFPKILANEIPVIVTKDAPELDRYFMGEEPILTVGYQLIDGMLAHIHIGMNESNMNDQIRVLRNRIMAFTLIVLVFGILLATFFSFRITVPLTQLADSMHAFGKGEKEEKIEFHGGGREVKKLTQSFKQMITERKKAEERINHINLVLRSLRDINQLITKEKNRDVLLQESCGILTRDKGYVNVWLVLFDEEHKINFVTKSGIGENFQLLINDLKKGKHSYCVKTALKQPEVLLIDDPEFECVDCPISGKYEGRNAIAVRLEYNKKIYGLLCARIEKEYLADEEMLDLFTEVTSDIAFAIYRLELEAKHKQAEKTLQESEEKFRNLVETSTDLVFRLTKTGHIVYVSPRVEEQYGYRPDELIGKHLKTTTPIGEVPMAIKAVTAVFAGKPLKNFEINQKHKSGRIIPMEINAVPVYQSGKIVGFQGIMRDITERKQAEEQIKRDLEEKNTLLQELYHRTKNNMQVISSMLKIQSLNVENRVQTGNSGIEFLQETFHEIINRIRSMSLVHQKLYQAKDLSHINLKEYIKDLINLLIISYGIKSEKITVKLELEDVFVLIDSAIPLGLVLNELISNVFKHAFPNSEKDEIHIKLYKEEDDTINIHLSDNGTGIPGDINLENINTMGLQTVFDLIKYQLKGELTYETENGLNWHFSFKDNLHKKRI